MSIFFLGTGKWSAQCWVNTYRRTVWKCSVNKFVCVWERPHCLNPVQNIPYSLNLKANYGHPMASILITSWQIDKEKVETVTEFVFLGSKITADSDWSHKIKRRLLLGRKAMRNLDNILKNRDITLLTSVNLVKAMVFPVVMYRCVSWTIKKAELRRTDASEL